MLCKSVAVKTHKAYCINGYPIMNMANSKTKQSLCMMACFLLYYFSYFFFFACCFTVSAAFEKREVVANVDTCVQMV